MANLNLKVLFPIQVKGTVLKAEKGWMLVRLWVPEINKPRNVDPDKPIITYAHKQLLCAFKKGTYEPSEYLNKFVIIKGFLEQHSVPYEKSQQQGDGTFFSEINYRVKNILWINWITKAIEPDKDPKNRKDQFDREKQTPPPPDLDINKDI